MDLPAPIRELAEQIETAAQVSINVVRSEPLHSGPHANAPAAARILSGRQPQLLLFSEPLAEDIAAHELLHFHRYLVEGVPQLTFTREISGLPVGYYVGTGAWMENHMEHFHIDPRMRELGYDLTAAALEKQWQLVSTVPRELQSTIPGRWSTLLYYATTQRCKSQRLMTLADEVLTVAGMLKEARAFSSGLGRVLADKIATCKFVMRAFSIPKDMTLLRYLASGDARLTIIDRDLAGNEVKRHVA